MGLSPPLDKAPVRGHKSVANREGADTSIVKEFVHPLVSPMLSMCKSDCFFTIIEMSNFLCYVILARDSVNYLIGSHLITQIRYTTQ